VDQKLEERGLSSRNVRSGEKRGKPRNVCNRFGNVTNELTSRPANRRQRETSGGKERIDKARSKEKENLNTRDREKIQ